MIDFAGLRVICYLQQDKTIVSGLLEDNFRIIKGENKLLELGVDKVGYNAIHLDACNWDYSLASYNLRLQEVL
jgi:ppGpp synthetase/RelA/SpoT-type nucleotidyltranferase